MEKQKTLTRSEVARQFGVCNRTVVNWRNEGLLTPLFSIRGRERYSLESILQLKNQSTNKIINE